PLQMGFQLARISPYHYLKRLFDVVASALLLVVSSPLIITSWCLIRATSKSPAIFGQLRVGREGHRFTAYKFRTMRSELGARSSEVGETRSEATDQSADVTRHMSHVTEED